jgi:hypothetical protein
MTESGQAASSHWVIHSSVALVVSCQSPKQENDQSIITITDVEPNSHTLPSQRPSTKSSKTTQEAHKRRRKLANAALYKRKTAAHRPKGATEGSPTGSFCTPVGGFTCNYIKYLQCCWSAAGHTSLPAAGLQSK